MLIREIVAAHVKSRSRVLVGDDGDVLATRLVRWELGSLGDKPGPDDIVVKRVTDPFDVASYWPTGLPLGARVIVVVDRGIGEVPVSRTVESARVAGLAIVDSIEVSDVGTASLAIIAERADVPVAPVSWLTGGLHSLVHDDETRITLAVGAHVLSRSVDTQRSDARFARLHQIKRERDLLAARVEELEERPARHRSPRSDTQIHGSAGYDSADYARMRRHLAAIERSRTWKVGRFFWALRHPVLAVRGEAREISTSIRLPGRTAP